MNSAPYQWINWWQALLGVVWWCNPFYHLLSKVMREVREECRDDAVLAVGLATNHAYSSAILAVAALAHPQPQPRIALHSLGHHLHPLAARLVRIADPTIARRARLTAPQRCLLVLCALIILPSFEFKGASLVSKESKGTAEESSAVEFDHPDGHDAHQSHQQKHRATHQHH
jgi:beta-lactamase regulating signal transducer with metallopeptidase domain